MVTGISGQPINHIFKAHAVEEEYREQVGAFLYSGGCNRFSGRARALTDYPNASTSSRLSSSTASPIQIRFIGCPETWTATKLRHVNIQEERRSHNHCIRSLKSRIVSFNVTLNYQYQLHSKSVR